MIQVFNKNGTINKLPFVKNAKGKEYNPVPSKITKENKVKIEKDLNTAMFFYYAAFAEIASLSATAEGFFNKNQRSCKNATEVFDNINQSLVTMTTWFNNIMHYAGENDAKVSKTLFFCKMCADNIIDAMRRDILTAYLPFFGNRKTKAAVATQATIARRLMFMSVQVTEKCVERYQLCMPDIKKFLMQKEIDNAYLKLHMAYLFMVKNVNVNLADNEGSRQSQKVLIELFTNPEFHKKVFENCMCDK